MACNRGKNCSQGAPRGAARARHGGQDDVKELTQPPVYLSPEPGMNTFATLPADCQDPGHGALDKYAQRRTYTLFISWSVTAVLLFALFQHLVVLNIPLQDMRPHLLAVPGMVGAVFGYLLAKIRLLHIRSRCQVKVITEREQRLRREIDLRGQVEASLREQQRQLETSNRELESFSYTVSHDLRAPLRSVSGFSEALVADCGDRLDDNGRDYIGRIQRGCERMDHMIDCLLALSRVSRADLVRENVDLSAIASDIAARLMEQEPGRQVEFDIEPGLTVEGDLNLLTIVLENLLGNAWRFTGNTRQARIGFGRQQDSGENLFCVWDNGPGFDSRHAAEIFKPFVRLHSQEQFPGSGIGLATVQRALLRQGGRIEAHGSPGEGARFCFAV